MAKDIVQALVELIPVFEKSRPIALWLVDSPHLKEIILDRFTNVKLYYEWDWREGGLPLYEWWTSAEQDGDKKPDLPFLKPECAGLWIEMRNADHVHIDLDNVIKPPFWGQKDVVSMARSLRLAVVQQQYSVGNLSEEEARGLLSGPLSPEDDSTRYDDAQFLLDQFYPLPDWYLKMLETV
jgi:hypothetical protein